MKKKRDEQEQDLLLLKMKLILQYQELLILNDMEEADNGLIKKLNENRTKKQELQGKGVLITVGTTNFNSLIEEIDAPLFYEQLIKAGFQRVYFQIGHGKY